MPIVFSSLALSGKLYASSVLQTASILYNFSHSFPPSWIILLLYLPFDLLLSGCGTGTPNPQLVSAIALLTRDNKKGA